MNDLERNLKINQLILDEKKGDVIVGLGRSSTSISLLSLFLVH